MTCRDLSCPGLTAAARARSVATAAAAEDCVRGGPVFTLMASLPPQLEPEVARHVSVECTRPAPGVTESTYDALPGSEPVRATNIRPNLALRWQ